MNIYEVERPIRDRIIEVSESPSIKHLDKPYYDLNILHLQSNIGNIDIKTSIKLIKLLENEIQNITSRLPELLEDFDCYNKVHPDYAIYKYHNPLGSLDYIEGLHPLTDTMRAKWLENLQSEFEYYLIKITELRNRIEEIYPSSFPNTKPFLVKHNISQDVICCLLHSLSVDGAAFNTPINQKEIAEKIFANFKHLNKSNDIKEWKLDSLIKTSKHSNWNQNTYSKTKEILLKAIDYLNMKSNELNEKEKL